MGGMSQLALDRAEAARKEPQSESVPSLPVVQSDAASIMTVISRAASDPATDVDKLERLLGMYERITARQAEADYTAALAEMQPELPVIAERGKIDIGRGKPQAYALWEDINDAIKPLLARFGFALSFRTGHEADKIVVTGVLSHRGGHSEQTTIHLPADTSGSKNAVQAVGSSTSYGKRYVACALLNITSRNDPFDDDGVMAGARTITDAQRDELLTLAEEAGADKRAFCEYMGCDSISAIPARDYRKAKDALTMKKNRGSKS